MTAVSQSGAGIPGTGALRRVLIVAPHFPPSNLAGVHRSRLFAQHLPTFGWEPVVVAVHPDCYEERLDPHLEMLLPKGLRVEHVGALPTRPIRVVGDMGIRGFLPLARKLLRLIDEEGADFLLIPIPSNYAALLGPLIHSLRGVPYGIDYIDPWIYQPTNHEGWKGRTSLALARILEPIAVREASLITGVAESYYEGVLERNPRLRGRAVTAAMPYGGEGRDHTAVREFGIDPALFRHAPGRFRLVYAGAMLPHAIPVLEEICAAIAAAPEIFTGVEFHFIGTGQSPDDPAGFNVRPVAERYGLWGTVIHEHPARIPYLDVLAHLSAADAVFVLGSTEAHYTPSKVYQGILSGKPILAVLHAESSACKVLSETGAGLVLAFDGAGDLPRVGARFGDTFSRFRSFVRGFTPGQVDQSAFEQYSARSVTGRFARALDEAVDRSARRPPQ